MWTLCIVEGTAWHPSQYMIFAPSAAIIILEMVGWLCLATITVFVFNREQSRGYRYASHNRMSSSPRTLTVTTQLACGGVAQASQ